MTLRSSTNAASTSPASTALLAAASSGNCLTVISMSFAVWVSADCSDCDPVTPTV